MRVQIFDVEHGACALITADTGAHVLIDCGHNTSTDWRPSTYLPGQGITTLAELIIANYDRDHASDLPNLLNVVEVQVLRRNPTITPDDLVAMKAKKGMSPGIQSLVDMARVYTAAVANQPSLGALKLTSFYNPYPEFKEENDLSLATFLEYPGLCMLFPGDLERPGWLKLLENPFFVQHLMRVHVLVASHHGRWSGCCEEMFQLGWQPQIVIMSDCGIQHETQLTAQWYGQRCTGIHFNGEPRWVLTTRCDGRIEIDATPYGATVSAHRAELGRRRA